MSDRLPGADTPPLERVRHETTHVPPPAAPGALPPEVRSLPESRRFGKYALVARLGRGGMGDVWKAWDAELSRWVALKVLRNEFEDDVPRFRQEASILGFRTWGLCTRWGRTRGSSSS
jgi:serine/threonine protein kinase